MGKISFYSENLIRRGHRAIVCIITVWNSLYSFYCVFSFSFLTRAYFSILFNLGFMLLSSPHILPVTNSLDSRPHSLSSCNFIQLCVESTTTVLATPLTCFKFMWLCHLLQETLSLCWSGADSPLTHLAVLRLTEVIE